MTPKLSPALIAEASLELVDRTGEFTIAALAAALKVSASSLYNHVTGKADVVELMRGRIMAGVDLSAAGGQWENALRAIAHSYRDAYANHPRVLPLATAYSVRDETTIELYNVLANILHGAGFAVQQQLSIITVLDSFILGSALDAAAPTEVWAPGSAAGEALQAALEAGMRKTGRAAESFNFGLDLIISGLRPLLP